MIWLKVDIYDPGYFEVLTQVFTNKAYQFLSLSKVRKEKKESRHRLDLHSHLYITLQYIYINTNAYTHVSIYTGWISNRESVDWDFVVLFSSLSTLECFTSFNYMLVIQ